MKKFFSFFTGLIKNDFRDFQTIFWAVIFPVVLFIIFSSIFGGFSEGDFKVRVGLVKEEEFTGLGAILDTVLTQVSGENGPLIITEYDDVDEAVAQLRRDKQDVVLQIPDGTSAKITSEIMIKNSQVGAANLNVYYFGGNQFSEISRDIVVQIMNGVNTEIEKRQNNDFQDYATQLDPVSSEGQSFSYDVYYLLSVLLMSYIIVSVFNMPMGLLEAKEKGTNKKIFSTPISPLFYFSTYLLKTALVGVLSTAVVYLYAGFISGINDPRLYSPQFIGVLLFSLAVMLSIGMMMAVLVKKFTTLIGVSQIANYLFMFLGGLWFPVISFPWAIRWITYVLPTTYLIEMMRRLIGLTTLQMDFSGLFLVPLIWLIGSIVIFFIKFKRVMGYE
ncbi:MAG: type transport system permease protein [Kosmotogales bacterium]|nr:type transport system permease protein [Kosmotogales bacterium]